MKNLIQFTTALALFVYSLGYGQTTSTNNVEVSSSTEKPSKTIIETEKFKSFIGTFLLEEGNFELQIVQEDNQMFIISPYSKDILIQKNDSTLREPSRGVDLERIADDKNALIFMQNGYLTTIKRV
ncbi:MAG: hypothetical protein K0U54_03175, partial [Bacteroidetes bacterium]|nr:hypothetical protein [Bacteroidota bacterium]